MISSFLIGFLRANACCGEVDAGSPIPGIKPQQIMWQWSGLAEGSIRAELISPIRVGVPSRQRRAGKAAERRARVDGRRARRSALPALRGLNPLNAQRA